jgi:DNA-binding transcriptional LysR family regulator
VPSAISHAIKALEEALGVSLFDRAGHRVALTPAGERVAELARRVLDHADALGTAAGQLRDGWEAELRLVVDGALPMGPITAALRALGDAGAPTRIRVDVECQDGVRDRFDDDHADIMLTLELDRGRVGLELIPMPPLRMLLLAAPAHPLGRAAGLRRPDLRAHTELVVRDTSPRLARTPRPAFLGTPSVIYLSDFHSKRLALLAAAGFGWIPEHLVADDLAAGALVPVDLVEGNTWTYEPHLATRTAQPPGRAGTLLIQALRAAW